MREHLDASAYPMTGQLISVGGYRLHIHCTGSGSPTVVLQPGGGDMSPVMGWIAPTVAAHTRVCVYYRAGRGWSDPSNTTQDGEQIATDLHTLLHHAHVPGPYVLAGHSFGGLYVRIFAHRYHILNKLGLNSRTQISRWITDLATPALPTAGKRL